MTGQQILIGIAAFLHNIFTVVWVGGLIVFVITLLPTARAIFGNSPQTRNLMSAVLKRHRIWVYISIAGLFITGIIQARLTPGFSGLMQFDTLYSTLTSIKHILTFVMIGIALYRSLIVTRKAENATPKQYQMSLVLIFINAVLGVLVLLFSGLMAAL